MNLDMSSLTGLERDDLINFFQSFKNGPDIGPQLDPITCVQLILFFSLFFQLFIMISKFLEFGCVKRAIKY